VLWLLAPLLLLLLLLPHLCKVVEVQDAIGRRGKHVLQSITGHNATKTAALVSHQCRMNNRTQSSPPVQQDCFHDWK
jgi:hypothetical protein